MLHDGLGFIFCYLSLPSIQIIELINKLISSILNGFSGKESTFGPWRITMPPVLLALISFLRSLLRTRRSMQLEILSLRHQLSIFQLTVKRPKLTPADRIFWSWFSKICFRWQEALTIVQSQTVIAWRRRKFKEQWRKLSRRGGRPGRAKIEINFGVQFCSWLI